MLLTTGESPFLDDEFITYELFFNAPAKVDSEFFQDANGNPVLEASPGNAPVRLQALLRPTYDPKIIAMMGADALSSTLRGRCVNPMNLPEGLIPGCKASLTVNGVEGVFTLGPAWRSIAVSIEEAIGQRLLGTWTSTNHPEGTS